MHDPLINWRLFNFNEVPQTSNFGNAHMHPVADSDESVASRDLAQPLRGARERELLQVLPACLPQFLDFVLDFFLKSIKLNL